MQVSEHRNGAVSESVVEAELHKLGHAVSVPMVERPYDLIAEIDGDLKKVQVKTLFERDGSLRAELRPRSRGTTASYSAENVDAFALHSPQLDEVYWLPFEEAPASEVNRKPASWSEHAIDKRLS